MDTLKDWQIKQNEYEIKKARAKALKLRLSCSICGEKAKLNCPCGTTQYCSTDCQRIDWRERGHKKACKKVRDDRAAETARAEDPAPPPSPPEEVFYGPAPRSGADEVRARIAAEHEAARARREANPVPEPQSVRFGSCCPICREDWVPHMETSTYVCCCKKICKSCSDKLGSAPCPLCRAPPPAEADVLAHIRRHAKDEVPEAVKLLGDAYLFGHYGLVRSNKRSAKLYKRAMELGDVGAMNRFARYCFFGACVKRDLKTAIRLWRMAADRGNAEAQYMLGFFYENGSRIKHVDDFEVNLWEASSLYARSAAQGFKHAKDDWDDLTLRITEAMVDQKLNCLKLDVASVRRGQSVRPRSREGPFRLHRI